MAKFIFFTDLGYAISPKGEELENLQILGIEDGQTEEDALKKLFKENKWILESGFSKENIKCYCILKPKVLNDIKVVLEYLWSDEEKHFHESEMNNESVSEHIYINLKKIKDVV